MSKAIAWCLMDANGKMYWDDEECVWPTPGVADEILQYMKEQSPDDGWHLMPLFTVESPKRENACRGNSG